MSDEQGEIGYGRPPVSTRFRKGVSGNSRGRPRGRRQGVPYEAVLGQVVTVQDGGVDRRMTVAEAFLLRETKRGLDGDALAARWVSAVMEATRETRVLHSLPSSLTRVVVRPGSVNSALSRLKMAEKLDRFRPTARMALEPWLVEAALARLGDRKLTKSEQAEVYRGTRTPQKVQWPAWWSSDRGERHLPRHHGDAGRRLER